MPARKTDAKPDGGKTDYSRIAFHFSGIVLLCLVAYLAGMYASTDSLPAQFVVKVKTDVATTIHEAPNLTGLQPINWTVARRHPGRGVTINEGPSGWVFLQGFFDSGLDLRLLRRDGRIMARWPVSYKALAGHITHVRNPPATDWNVGFFGALMQADGSVVFILTHVGLFKFDRCGKLIWSVDEPVHHAVEQNADGSFWVASSDAIDKSDDPAHAVFKPPYAADTIIHVSADGKVLEEISLVEVFVKNNAAGLLTLTGEIVPGTLTAFRPDFEREIFHLNDVEELSPAMAPAFPMFKAGDLLLSLRNRNLILVMDPKSQIIKWWHIGPWIRQHDPDWNRDGKITLFDNNRDGTDAGKILGSSRIIAVDPATRETSILYGGPGEQFFYSERRGRHQMLENGGMLIAETEAGRVFQIDRDRKLVWEYINQYNESLNVRITDAIVYQPEFFNVKNWSCAKR